MQTGLRSSDIPHVFELLHPSEEQQNAFLLAQNLHAMNAMFVLPPGTPQEVVHAWRSLIRDAASDLRTHSYAASLASLGYSGHIGYRDPEILRGDINRARNLSSAACRLFLDLYGNFTDTSGC